MFNYFTIPEIDIAFTIATTKLIHPEIQDLGLNFMSVWVYVSVSLCGCMSVTVSVYTL